MKNGFKFLGIAAVLLLASSVILTGGLYVISAEKGDAKTYNTDSRIVTDNTFLSSGDSPTSQSELQNKFSAMYSISEDGKSITVVSKEYLEKYWSGNYEEEVIRSLGTEEVYFIIQDSIRIYMQYEKVILEGFESASSVKEVAERFPCLETQEISRPVTPQPDSDRVEKDIYTIVLYRLKALSSPKSFFTGAEAVLFVGGLPDIYSSMLPFSTYYIPNYSNNTDRDYILSVIGHSARINVTNVDLDKYSDLFGFCDKNRATVSFSSKATEQSILVYPTDEMYKVYGLEDNNDSESNHHETDATELENNNTPYFKVDIQNSICYLMSSDGSAVEAKGFFTHEGNVYVLHFDNDYQYLFYYIEGIGFQYGKAESNPLPGYEFDNGDPLVIEKDTLTPIEE